MGVMEISRGRSGEAWLGERRCGRFVGDIWAEKEEARVMMQTI